MRADVAPNAGPVHRGSSHVAGPRGSAARDQVGRDLGVPGRAVFILRVGYVTTYPQTVSLRMPVSWFVHTRCPTYRPGTRRYVSAIVETTDHAGFSARLGPA